MQIISDALLLCSYMSLIEQQPQKEEYPRSGNNIVLELRGVSKAFLHENKTADRHRVLDGINLDVREGEFVTIVGPSGCGKSTLLNIVAGLDAPDSGLVSVRDGSDGIRKAQRVVIFQEGALFPWLTVSDNVEFGLKVAGVTKESRRATASRFIEMAQLAKFADSYIYQLSGGMKQRVAIARALALDPRILLMDEPFAALDVQTRDILHEQLVQIHQSTGKTILFVTHDINEAVLLGDRIIVLSPRTGNVKKEIAVNHPRPRDIESHEISAIRRELLRELEEDFQIAKRNHNPQEG
ncbi:ABC-type nitrate/sulfonate/bicarbonate transport system, ATPase component [Candidatus Nitrososphaera evergladensis SR1]|uniref:ABC-type nitrate/sulfonate/bicarbonate transport system, ATPase component n=2 Tax=Nitrososphaera TaxID=497726 RepID=A0A075MV82_9ARCH|nr:ABC-type nitrate/sulfonate/bicarbonate transport system, ATPase component [Candidatus Nitrososphaera evergladensis SR1]